MSISSYVLFWHSSALFQFICFLYKVYDHLCARLWFLQFFYASLYVLFSVLLSLILFISSLFLVLYI